MSASSFREEAEVGGRETMELTVCHFLFVLMALGSLFRLLSPDLNLDSLSGLYTG